MKLFAIATLFLFGTLSSSWSQTFSNPASITIPNSGFLQGPASPYPSAINVSGAGTQLASISVTLADFSHFYPADVDVLLVGPQGQNVMLMSDVGTFFPVNSLTFTFNNTAGASMPSNAQLSSGTYAPTNFDPVGDVDGFPAPAPMVGPYGSSFTPFLGTNPNGTWSLYVLDDVAGNDGQIAGGWSLTITTSGAPALQLTSAASRKTHGAAGDFDIDLPLTGEFGVECRSGVAGHTLVFTFTNSVVSGNASVTGGTGSVSGSPTFAGDTMTVNLTGVTDVQTLAVTLSNVTDSFAQVLPNTVVSANFLLGDTTGNKSVNASDVGATKGQSGASVIATNFRNDIGANGAINASDVGQAKAASGNSIP
jgi:subtilisin-like proprotein convertase family protein